MFSHNKYRPSPIVQNSQRNWPNQTIRQAPTWCAVDLRDGNQALMEPMSVEQKQTLWHLLIDMGFKHIEVGFPSASQPDFDFVRWLIEENQIPQDVTIQVLVQARESLIARTFQALNGVKRAIVHVYNSTSPVQREKVFNLDKAGIIAIAQNGARLVKENAKQYPDTDWTFQYSPESFSSTEVEFAVEVCNAVIDEWQPEQGQKTIINLPATVECAGPNVFADQVEVFCRQIQQRAHIHISVHTHNDRGCAVAAAELAVMAGADRVEGTLMGNGERTGNMDIITMAMNLYSQGIDPQLDMRDAARITRTVEQCTQIPTHARHPWMGDLVYTAFSGSHQDAIKKCLAQQKHDDIWDVAYLPIDPKDIGRDYQSVIRVNSQSGKGGVAFILEEEFGIQLPRWMQIEVSQAVQAHTERHQCEVNGQSIYQIFQQTYVSPQQPIAVEQVKLSRNQSNNHEQISAHVSFVGQNFMINGHGQGALEAMCHGLSQQFNVDMDISQYHQSALGHHRDSQAMTMVQMSINGQKQLAIGYHQDTVSASLLAILKALESTVIAQSKVA